MAKNYNKMRQERNEFLDRMLMEVHRIPVQAVVGSYIKLVQRGPHLMGLCPFHPDHRLGSFVVTPKKNLWYCFADSLGGSSVNFVMEYEGLEFLPAAFKLAREYRIISDEEYEKYSERKWDEKAVNKIRDRLEKKDETPARRADADVIAAVYNAMANVSYLSAEHKNHLFEERKLYEEQVRDFFTFPTRRVNLAEKVLKFIAETISNHKMGKALSALTMEERAIVNKSMERVKEQLPYVPGFYLNNETGKVDFASYKGIGFVVRDDRGKPLGIQIRRDNVKKGESRYVWFSSAFAEAQEYSSCGASSGSPGGYVAARNQKSATPPIVITEGRFKAEKIADGGSHAIYVSGVSAWKPIIPILNRIKGNARRIFLAFDADMLGNVAVYRQLSALAGELKKMKLTATLILWSKDYGKGFDDLVNEKGDGYSHYLKYVAYEKFLPVYEKMLNEVLNSFGVKRARDIAADRAEAFTVRLQNAMEDALDLRITNTPENRVFSGRK